MRSFYKASMTPNKTDARSDRTSFIESAIEDISYIPRTSEAPSSADDWLASAGKRLPYLAREFT
jgi:hypothetical protein